MQKPLCHVLFALSLVPRLVFGDTLSIDNVMSTQEQENSGLDRLSPNQRAALEKWITKWTQSVLSQAPTYHPSQPLSQWVAHWPPYLQPHPPSHKEIAKEREADNMRIFRNDNGEVLELKDGSVWKIHPTDVSTACWWKRNQPISVIKSPRDIARPYILLNTARNEQAGAQRIKPPSAEGERPPDPPSYFRGSVLLEAVGENGETITIDGGAVWKIAPISQLQVSATWRVRDRLRIERSTDAIYRYKISNLDNGGSSLANPQ